MLTLTDLPARIDDPVRLWECEDESHWWALECERRRLRLAAFAAIEDPETQDLALGLERALCSQSVRHFVEQYVWIQDPHRTSPPQREIPLVLWDAQVELLDRAQAAMAAPKGSQDADLIVIKSREMGVSWCMQALLYWRFLFQPQYSGFCLSRSQPVVDDFTPNSLFGKFRFIHERLPGFLRPELTRDVHLHLEHGSSKLGGDSTNKDALRGFRGGDLLLDEFASIETAKQERVWLATETVARTRLVVSTASGPANRFAELVGNHPNVLEIPWHQDPRRTEEWAASKRDSMGPKAFDQEYGARVVTLDRGSIWHVRRGVVRYGEAGMEEGRAIDPVMYKTQPIVGGWDFGSGESLLVCLFSVTEHLKDGSIRLWIDRELTWQRTGWRTAAADTLATAALYPSRDFTCYGDPAGIQADSSQESWESNLRAGGVPIFCLPGEINTRDEIEWSIRIVQAMLADDLIRVHDRCEYLWQCLEYWSRDVPHGLEVDFVSRAYIGPKKDVYSHGAMALVYLVRGALLQAETRAASTVAARGGIRELLAEREGMGEMIRKARR